MHEGLRRSILCVAVVAVSGPSSFAQTPIPELVAKGLTRKTVGSPSGVSAPLSKILSQVTLIVRGTVASARSYLSDDQTSVYTDYVIESPSIVFRSEAPPPATRPGLPPPLIVTLLGGRIEVAGETFIHSDHALPALAPGIEVVLLLERDAAGKYRPVHGFLGAFQVARGRLTRLTRVESFAPEMEGREVGQALSEMATMAIEGRQRRGPELSK